MHDTIVACITGSPPAAVAWVRLSGPDAFRIASQVFEPWPPEPEPRKALIGRFAHGDKGLALPFPEGHSYTGEESVELSVHGGRASVRALLEACQLKGARAAGPGEFTLRAFMNGRIDLVQAEAIAETVEAETDRQLREANRNREGGLSGHVRQLRGRVLDVLAQLEASVDFYEEIGEPDPDEIEASIRLLVADLELLLDRGRNSHLARRGLRVAILGRPNAGKSSLLNALLGIDRAIVTDVPGTTRDTVEEATEFEGIRVVLTDTAGLRATDDPVESIGVQRSRQAAHEADLILYVYDAAAGWTPEDEEASRTNRPTLVAGNKCDLEAPEHGLAVSCKTGEGLRDLISRIVAGLASAPDAPAVNERQAVALQQALESLRACADSAAAQHPPDLLSVLLGETVAYLGRVTGETASPDMLDEIFSRFCIGK